MLYLMKIINNFAIIERLHFQVCVDDLSILSLNNPFLAAGILDVIIIMDVSGVDQIYNTCS